MSVDYRLRHGLSAGTALTRSRSRRVLQRVWEQLAGRPMDPRPRCYTCHCLVDEQTALRDGPMLWCGDECAELHSGGYL